MYSLEIYNPGLRERNHSNLGMLVRNPDDVVMLLPDTYDMDDEGLGELGFVKKAAKSVKKGAKKVGKVAKKAAPIAIPVAGVALAPFTGGTSLAIAGAAQAAMAASGKFSTSEKVGAGILAAGTVGYGAYNYSQTGSVLPEWLRGSTGVGQGVIPRDTIMHVPNQMAIQPPMIPHSQGQQLWEQQAQRNPVVTIPVAATMPETAASFQSFGGGSGGMQVVASEGEQLMQASQGKSTVAVSTDTLLLGGLGLVGAIAFMALG